MTDSNQKSQKSKLNWVDYILIVTFIVIITILVINFLTPTIGDFLYEPVHVYIYMTKSEYTFVTETINSLIVAEDRDIEELFYVLKSTRVRDDVISECNAFDCLLHTELAYYDERTHALYHFLNQAAYNVESSNFNTRYYLWRAKICWEFNICTFHRHYPTYFDQVSGA
ncbi:MAG TPA: hypothetical protein VJ965_05950 [Anaerolineales bacterium]|nr:hypothetical protein [Anaerolineales bacterium]